MTAQLSKASIKGNFHAILVLFGNSDKNLKEPLLTGRRNSTSASKTVQEEVCLGETYTADSEWKTLFSQSLAMR